MTLPDTGHPTRWLCEGPPTRLADRLVAAGTHDPTTAAQAAAAVDDIVDQCDRHGPDEVAQRLLGPDAHPQMRTRHQHILVAAAATAMVPLWNPPTSGPRTLRRLDGLARGAIRAVARTRPDRLVPVAIAEQGATTAQMVDLDLEAFTRVPGQVTVALPSSARATVARTIALAPWSHQGVTDYLEQCRQRGLGPCYRGHDPRPAKVAKSISARIDRVLADAGVAATAVSLRYTAGHDALEAGGPVAAMRTLGVARVELAMRFLGR